MKLSIIVVSWNVREDLVRCLRSIEENPPGEGFEIIVVDNNSCDGTVEYVKANFPMVNVVANSENRGFAAANNQGLCIAMGQYILFLNPDTLVLPKSLEKLTEFLDNNEAVGACGPIILDPGGESHQSIGKFPTFRYALYGKTVFRFLGIFRGHYRKFRLENFDHSNVESISGAALMVRRSVIEQVGPMDEIFFLYYEDLDLCLRIRKAGWRIAYVADSKIVHIGGQSASKINAARERFVVCISLLNFFRKHRSRIATATFSLIFKVGVILRDICNFFIGSVTYILAALALNKRRRRKSAAKVKNSVISLAKYSWRLLFKI